MRGRLGVLPAELDDWHVEKPAAFDIFPIRAQEFARVVRGVERFHKHFFQCSHGGDRVKNLFGMRSELVDVHKYFSAREFQRLFERQDLVAGRLAVLVAHLELFDFLKRMVADLALAGSGAI